jgi:hypothetical protein
MVPYDDLLECDTFMNDTCVNCGSKAALFATPRMFGACPRCLAERMRQLIRTGAPVPEWVPYLEKAGEREAARQEKAEEAQFSVSFDDLFRCARCEKVGQEQDARYYFPPGA